MQNLYQQLLADGSLHPDEKQKEIAKILADFQTQIEQYKPKKLSFLGKLFGAKQAMPNPQGYFIYGKVGRGKSMIMDLFYQTCDEIGKKQRIHFHEFMQNIHTYLAEHRKNNIADPLKTIAQEYFNKAWLICFDEYEVIDVADAVILMDLFKYLFDMGAVFIFTSNKPPIEHFKGGLQRTKYEQFVDYLQGKIEVLNLNSNTDYRTTKTTNYSHVYNTAKSLQSAYIKCFEGASQNKQIKLGHNRYINFISYKPQAQLVDFNEVCTQKLSAKDYLKTFKNNEYLYIANIPQLTDDESDATKRFITLIDVLYEAKVKLFLSTKNNLEDIYIGKKHSFEFKRTLSRLKEMLSDEYHETQT